MSGYLVSLATSSRLIPPFQFPARGTILDETDFRNSAHLRFKADPFVPCGGRYVISHIRDVCLIFPCAAPKRSKSPISPLSLIPRASLVSTTSVRGQLVCNKLDYTSDSARCFCSRLEYQQGRRYQLSVGIASRPHPDHRGVRGPDDIQGWQAHRSSEFSQSYIKDRTHKKNLPRSTSVAYEKDAQSTATRRLNLSRYLQSTSTLSPSKRGGHLAPKHMPNQSKPGGTETTNRRNEAHWPRCNHPRGDSPGQTLHLGNQLGPTEAGAREGSGRTQPSVNHPLLILADLLICPLIAKTVPPRMPSFTIISSR